MAPRMIGLTGGIGTGKSVVAAILRELGAEVINADDVAHEVVRPGRPAYDDIVLAFGKDILQSDAAIDRKKLAAIVFADEKARHMLEAITHPRVAVETARRIADAGASGRDVVVYEAPLLIEARAHEGLAGLIVVVADEAAQIARVVARDGLTEEEVRRRIAAQLPTAEKAALADYVIRNTGSLEDMRRQVEAAWRDIAAGGPTGRAPA